MQIIRDNCSGPILALLGAIAVVERLCHLLVPAGNREPAEAKPFESKYIGLTAIRARQLLIVSVGNGSGIRIEIERRQLGLAIRTARRPIQRHKLMCATVVNPPAASRL